MAYSMGETVLVHKHIKIDIVGLTSERLTEEFRFGTWPPKSGLNAPRIRRNMSIDIIKHDAMMPFMRSTVRIDDDLMMEIKERARRENVSLTRMLNRVLREGIQVSRERRSNKSRYREKTIAMGIPRADLDKALALAADIEDEEILRKMTLKK